MFDFASLKVYWPHATALVVSGAMVAKSTGYFPSLDQVSVESFMAAGGALLSALAIRSGMAAQANATILTAATQTANKAIAGAAAQSVALEAQAATLQEASRAVVSAAVAQPTADVIAAAGQAAGVIHEVSTSIQAINDYNASKV